MKNYYLRALDTDFLTIVANADTISPKIRQEIKDELKRRQA